MGGWPAVVIGPMHTGIAATATDFTDAAAAADGNWPDSPSVMHSTGRHSAGRSHDAVIDRGLWFRTPIFRSAAVGCAHGRIESGTVRGIFVAMHRWTGKTGR